MTKSNLLIALIIGSTFSLPVAAKMYKWVDDKGTTHYGETIPPEYANKDRSVLGKDGRVIKTQEVLTPEERRAKEQMDAQKRKDDEAASEEKRRDRTLLNTYSNVTEIDLARSRNLQQVDTRINSTNTLIKRADDNLLALQKEADNLSKANRPIPASLQDDLKESQSRLTKLRQELAKHMEEKASVEARYDADKVRYKELTGK